MIVLGNLFIRSVIRKYHNVIEYHKILNTIFSVVMRVISCSIKL